MRSGKVLKEISRKGFKGEMNVIKILRKGQITLPKDIRKSLDIKEGDILLIERAGEGIVMKKGKTIFDFVGILPNKGLSLEEMREKAIEEAVKDND